MSNETPAETIERLETLNHKLSIQIIGMSDRLNGSILQIAQSAWNEGAEALTDHWTSTQHNPNERGPVDEPGNPYTEMIKNKMKP